MKGIFASLAAALVIIAVLFYGLYSTAGDAEKEKITKLQPKYHIQIVTQKTDEHFWTMFKKGASSAGTKLDTYVEFVDIAQKDTESSVQAIEKAVASNVDGIALQAQDITKTSAALQIAKKNNISAITFENELGDIQDIPNVGSNSYAIGQKEGQMGVESCKYKGNIAVIVNGSNEKETSSGQKNQYKSLKLQGIAAAVSKYPQMKISDVYTLNSGMFETEKLMNTILTKNPKVKLIICTDERSTPSVAQAIVDSNQVGDISIIGYGAMPQTLNYIEHGVIYGAICPDAYQIGYQTVSQLYDILDKKQITDSLNTELFSITKTNVSGFMVKANDK